MFKVVKHIENIHKDAVWSVAWGSDQQLLTGSNDDTVKLWNITKEEGKDQPVKEYEGHCWGVTSIATSADKSVFVSVSLDSQVKVWDLSNGKKLRDIDTSPVETYAAAIHPDGERLAVTSNTGGLVLYNLKTGEQLQSFSLSESAYTFCVAISPDGNLAACGSWTSKKGLLTIFDLTNNVVIHSLEAHAMPIRAVAFSQNSQQVFTGSDDKHVKIYDIQPSSLSLISSVSGHASWVLDIACSLDSKYFATASCDNTVRVWDMSGKCLHIFNNQTDQVWALAWNADNQLAAVSADKSVIIYSCQ